MSPKYTLPVSSGQSPEQHPWSTGSKALQKSRFLPTQGLEPGLFTSPYSPCHPAASAHLSHQALTISWHAHCQALLQPAVLAAVAAGTVDQAVLLTGAGVGCIALLTPPEEALHRKGARKHLRLLCEPLWVEKCSGTEGSIHVFMAFQCWQNSLLIDSDLLYS